jgi:hypothetical protein
MGDSREGGKGMAKRILAVILLALIIAAAAVRFPAAESEPNGAEEIPPASVSRLYREADRILLAACTRTTEEDDGSFKSRFLVKEALEGSARLNEFITLPVSALSGEMYLLYLKAGDNGETLVSSEPFMVKDGAVICENETCSIESVRKDIERQRRILTVPAQSLFYGDIASLAEACDEIVVARVLSVDGPTETVCRAESKGESTISTLEQVFLRIKVENGLFGELRYGDKLSVVLSPYYTRPVINAATLTPKTVDPPPASNPKAGSVYIFFLIKSEDSKSDYYFTVNPYEGYVLLIGNDISHPYYNEAFREVHDIKRFSELLRAAMEPHAENE